MSSEAAPTDVLIIGAGLAGLSAAVALSSAGAEVRLLERKPYIGGRAYSYLHPALNEVIDSQHVMLGCCMNLVDLCNRSGASANIRWYDEITFLEAANGSRPSARRSVIGPSALLPAPAHSALSFLGASMLSLADKTRIGLGLREFIRGIPADDSEAFSTWLRRTHQTDRSIRHFWEPVILGALNDSFDRCSTRYAAQVFHESFLKSAQGGRLGIPTLPMSEFYAPLASLAQQQGTALELRAGVERISYEGGLWTAHTSTGVFAAPNIILALPFEQTKKLLHPLAAEVPAAQDTEIALEHFTHAPITTLHLWFDRAVTGKLDHAALLDTRIQWVFNKSRIRRLDETGDYLELVISGSFPELHRTRESLLTESLRELALFFPLVREAKLLRSGVLKEARATFSVIPGLDRYRLPAATTAAGLFLAGDWTRTGWPSTMEGAVRSGRLAAEAVALACATPSTFLAPDLPPAGLMRWLARRT